MADGQVTFDVTFSEDGSILKIKKNATDADNALKKLGETAKGAGKETDGIGAGENFGKMAGAIALATGAFALLKPVVTGLFNQFADFEQSFAKVNTLLPTGTTNLTSYKDGIMNVAKETGFATSELADGLYEAISAGVKPTEDGAEAMTFLSTSAKLAKGGFTSSASAVDTLTTVLNGYKMETSQATKVSDQLIAVQNYGKTTVDQLSKSLGNVVPVASAMGVGFDQVGASLAVLTSNGIQTAEATTALRSIMSQVGNSTTEMGKTFEKASGKSFQQFIKEGGTVAQALEMVKAQAEKTSTPIGKVVPQEAIAGFSVLSSTGGKFNEVLGGIQNSSGSTNDAFSKATQNMKDQWSIFIQNVSTSTAGLFSPLIESITFVLSEFNKFSQTPFGAFVSQVLVGVAGLVFAFAGLVAGVAIFQLVLPAITGALSALGAVFGAMSLPVVAIGVAIAGLVALIVMNWDLIVAKTNELWNAMSPIFNNLKAQFDALVPVVMNMVNNVIKFITDMWQLSQPIIQLFQKLFTDAFNLLLKIIPPITQAIGNVVLAMADFIITAINFVLPIIKSLAEMWMKYVFPVISSALNSIMNIVSSVFNAISGIIQGVLGVITGIFRLFTSVLKGDWQGAWNALGDIVNGALDAVKSLVGGVFNIGKDIVSGIVNGLASAGDSIKNFLLDMAKGALDAVKNFFGIKSPSRVFRDEVGVMLGKGMSIGIDKSSKEVDKSAKALAESAINNAKIDSLVGKSSLSDSIASRLSATVPLTSRNSSIGALNLTVNSNSADAGQVFTEMQSKLFDQIDNYLGGQYAY